MPRSGLGGATTVQPFRWRRSTTPFQLEASAKAPCTRTIVGEVVVDSDGCTGASMGKAPIQGVVGRRCGVGGLERCGRGPGTRALGPMPARAFPGRGAPRLEGDAPRGIDVIGIDPPTVARAGRSDRRTAP